MRWRSLSPSQFKTIPCPTYPEIRLALGAEEEIRERLRAFEPEAVHIATEGPIGIATRRICVGMEAAVHDQLPHQIPRVRLGPVPDPGFRSATPT